METPVTFSVNGTQIVGILHSSETHSAKSPAVIFLHGFTGTKVEPHRIFVKTARALTDAGFTCLRFDFRGWGDSGGNSEDSSITTFLEDARAATDFLLAQPRVDRERLGYIGMSTGGATAAIASARDSRVKSLALWNAVADGAQVLRGIASPGHLQSFALDGRVDHKGNWIGRQFITEFGAMKPADELARRPLPVLLIQGGKDDLVPAPHVEMYHRALDGKSPRLEKLLLPDADHTFSSVAWEKEVVGRTVKWLSETF